MALTLQDIRGTVDFAIVTVREDEFDAVLHAAVQALRPNTRSSTPLKDSELGKPVQLFKSPSDPIPTQFGDLRDSELYLMHPGLEDLIKAARHDYEVFHFAPVGQGYPWTIRTSAIVNAQRELHRLLRQGDTEMQLERRRHLRPKVLDILRVAHAHGSPGEDDRRPALARAAPALWNEVASVLTGSDEYRNLLFWVERALKGGSP